MINQFPNTTEARSIFLNRYIARGYQGVVQGEISMLKDGPPGRSPSPALVHLHEWFLTLDDQNRKFIESIIKETAFSSVFGCLVVLDNLTGGPPLQGEPSDFALFLQSYEDWDARTRSDPNRTIRLNSVAGNEEGLHDELIYALRESGDLPTG